jgi:dihydroxyacid dehydratase/phosphogluconate dehydratase
VGGPIAWVKNGDPIAIDAEKRTIDLGIPAAEFKRRKAAWKNAEAEGDSAACWRSMRARSAARRSAR